MNDFDGLLPSDFGFKQQGKSAPMAPPSKGSSNLNFDLGSRSSRNSNSLKNRDADAFGDLFSGSGSQRRGTDSPFNLDSVFPGPGDFPSRSTNSPPPVYDKPVYDEDIFEGVPGLKSTDKVNLDDVFVTPSQERGTGAFDDLLGGFGKESKSSGRKRYEKDDKGVTHFDDLLAGFGSSRPSSDRCL